MFSFKKEKISNRSGQMSIMKAKIDFFCQKVFSVELFNLSNNNNINSININSTKN